MPMSETFHDAFIEELRDTYDAEKQLAKALPKMAKAASSSELRSAFQKHLGQTQMHINRLEQVFSSLDEKVQGKHCKGIAGIIEEGESIMKEDFDEITMDACLIAGAQRAEHYEIAVYGTLLAWAQTMGHSDVADILARTLDEEKAANAALSSLAEGGINKDAAQARHGDGDQEGDTEGNGRASRRGMAATMGSKRAPGGSKPSMRSKAASRSKARKS